MSSPTYKLSAIADLLLVPADRREACVRNILYVLALHELTLDAAAVGAMVGPIVWVDDGDLSASIRERGGDELLNLTVQPRCTCRRCIKDHDLRDTSLFLPLSSTRMILCTECGNKRCPHASDHPNACTRSNEPGQAGSLF